MMSNLTRRRPSQSNLLRRSSDIETVRTEDLGSLAPRQKASVLARDEAIYSMRPTELDKADAVIRTRYERSGFRAYLGHIDGVIAERQLKADYGVQPSVSLDTMLDRIVVRMHLTDPNLRSKYAPR